MHPRDGGARPVDEVGPAACPDATPADDLGRADELVADAHRAEDRHLGGPRQPGQAALAYQARVKPRADEWYQARSWA